MTTTILCPTRGGKASQPNQERAIALARERKVGLIFLYVSNVSFMGMTAAYKLVDIEIEMEEMGEFLLAMAQERAEKAGVKADVVYRSGEFNDVLKEVIEEFQVGSVLLGSSAHGKGITNQVYIQELSQNLSVDTGVEFIVAYKGEIQNIYKT